MIKNIVWDIGGVLIDSNTDDYLKSKYNYSENDIDFINNNVFNSVEYQRDLNMGKTTIMEVEAKLIEKYPDKKEMIHNTLTMPFEEVLPIRRKVIEYIEKLKNNGYKTYLLSNISKEIKDALVEQDSEFENYFDGRVYSYEEGMLKPASDENSGSDLYRVLLNRYKLKANETVFIDDSKRNIEMASRVGIHGIQYTSLENTHEQLKRIIDREKEEMER